MVTINEGEQVIVDCVAGGNPLPLVTWQRSIFGLVNTLSNNSLIVYQASLDDSGRYFCVADNGLGQIYSTFDIVVRGELSIANFFTSLRKRKQKTLNWKS